MMHYQYHLIIVFQFDITSNPLHVNDTLFVKIKKKEYAYTKNKVIN